MGWSKGKEPRERRGEGIIRKVEKPRKVCVMEDWGRGSFRLSPSEWQYGLLKRCPTHLFPSQTICDVDVYRHQEQCSGGTSNNGLSKLRDEGDPSTSQSLGGNTEVLPSSDLPLKMVFPIRPKLNRSWMRGRD